MGERATGDINEGVVCDGVAGYFGSKSSRYVLGIYFEFGRGAKHACKVVGG